MPNQGNGTKGGPQQGNQGGGTEQDQDWRAQLQDQVERLTEQAQEHGSRLASGSSSAVREWPLTAVVGALAVGTASGYLLSNFGSARYTAP